MKSADKSHLDEEIRKDFADSLDIDDGLLEGHEQENRWDYLLGYSPTQAVVAVEPHSARTDEITTLIRKKAAAREQLRSHLQDGTRIAVWIWVASGDVQFADTEKAQRRLDEKGIILARKIITKKVLCTAGVAVADEASTAPAGVQPVAKARTTKRSATKRR
ncbi:MAG: hypothetical protein IT349_02745 [Candidatus Eisenbacteria bacterium]|nr:hypothetical protein [Candidatus Eisenbacteria bacterium]